MWPALITDAMHTCWALFPQKPLASEWRPTGVLYNQALIRQLVEGRSGLRSRSPALLSEEHSPTLVLHNVFVKHCSTSARQEPHQGTLGPRNGVDTSSLSEQIRSASTVQFHTKQCKIQRHPELISASYFFCFSAASCHCLLPWSMKLNFIWLAFALVSSSLTWEEDHVTEEAEPVNWGRDSAWRLDQIKNK